jgi:hypothetical protein
LAPESPEVSEAQVQIRTLGETCPSTAATPGSALLAPARPLTAATAPEAQGERAATPSSFPRERRINAHQGLTEREARVADGPRRWTRAKIATTLLVAGVVVGAGTGGFYWWNDSRHDRWSAEDRRLAGGPANNVSTSAWIERQNRNDALLRSIWHADSAVGVLSAVTAACVLTSALLGVLPERGPQVSVGPGGIGVALVLDGP